MLLFTLPDDFDIVNGCLAFSGSSDHYFGLNLVGLDIGSAGDVLESAANSAAAVAIGIRSSRADGCRC